MLRALDRGGVCVTDGIHMTPIPRIDYDTDPSQGRFDDAAVLHIG